MDTNRELATPQLSIHTGSDANQTWYQGIRSGLERTFLRYRALNLLSGPNSRSSFRNRPHPRLYQRTVSSLSAASRRIRQMVQRRMGFGYGISLATTAKTLWRVFDGVVLLGMGSGYVTRFEEFAAVSEGEGCEPLIREWRDEQQEEWSRLSTTLAILATMHAAILAITPAAPPLAFSLWLGGVSISVCALFIVQYFPIKAFSIRDIDMPLLLQDSDLGESESIISVTLLITAISSPAAMLMWAALLFVGGMIDYVVEVDMLEGGFRYIAAIPLAVGVIFMVLTVVIGEIIERKLTAKNKTN